MSSPFARSTRSLEADGFRRWGLVLGVALLLLGGWGAWFFLARVSVYETTRLARLEVNQEVRPVVADAAGRVVQSHLEVGRQVKAGEALVELDSDPQQLQLGEERARLTAIAPQIRALLAELRAEGQALGKTVAGTKETLAEARARHQEAQAQLAYARAQLERYRTLSRGGHTSKAELQRVRAEASQRRAAAEARRIAVGRLDWEHRVQRADRRTRIARLRRDLAVLRGERLTRRATIKRLEYEIERRRIRAPISGRLGEASTLPAGSVIAIGDRLATIIPTGKVKIVAHFLPAAALGRIRAGQAARLRLDGFPWAQYGTLGARVALVAAETRFGRVRVEATLTQPQQFPVPLRHGLPGTLEVEIERVSPATLVLRAAGALVEGSGSGSSPAP